MKRSTRLKPTTLAESPVHESRMETLEDGVTSAGCREREISDMLSTTSPNSEHPNTCVVGELTAGDGCESPTGPCDKDNQRSSPTNSLDESDGACSKTVSSDLYPCDKRENLGDGQINPSREIKKEFIPNYSVDDWCELGPSVHEFGHSSDFDIKDDIKKSPKTDLDANIDGSGLDLSRFRNSESSHNRQGACRSGEPLPKVTEASHDEKDSDNDAMPGKTELDWKDNVVLVDGDPQYEAMGAVYARGSPDTKSQNQNRLSSDEKNVERVRLVEVEKNETFKVNSDSIIQDRIKTENENADQSTEVKQTHPDNALLTPDPNQYKTGALTFDPIDKHPNGNREPGITKELTHAQLLQSETFNLTSKVSHLTAPASFNDKNTNTVFSLQQQQQRLTATGHTLVLNDFQGLTRPSFNFQSPADLSAPRFSQNILAFPKGTLRENPLTMVSPSPAQNQSSSLVTSSQQFYTTSIGNSRLYQTWVKPNPFGYFHYQPNVTPHNRNNSNNNNENNNNKLMLLNPQAIFLQQLPYLPIFQQSTIGPYGASPPSQPANQTQVMASSVVTNNAATTLSNADQPANHFPSLCKQAFKDRNMFGLDANSCLKSSDTVRSESGIIHGQGKAHDTKNQLVSCTDNVNHSNFRDEAYVEKHLRQTHGGGKGSTVNIAEIKAVHHVLNESSTTDGPALVIDHSQAGNKAFGIYGKGYVQGKVLPKMCRGDDFVDPTRIKLDQDDDVEDNGNVYNGEDDSSDEDWVPESRDEDKGIGIDNRRDIDVDGDDDEEEEEEDEEEGESHFGTNPGGNKRKRQGKLLKGRNKKQHPENTMACHYCGKTFNGNYHLKRHMLSHTENRPHQCSICGKRFKQKAHLHGHEIVHLREKSRPPKDKNDNENNENNNNNENSNASSSCGMNKNNSSSPYKCPGRPKKVYSEKELSCNVCTKVFKTLYRLKRHVQSHTDVRPYACKVCGKGFKQTGHRNEHEANHEKNRRKFLCNICGVIFHCRSSFNNHLKTHRSQRHLSGDKGSNNQLDAGINSPSNEREGDGRCCGDGEDAQHTGYDCPYCTDKFATAQGLNRHLDSHVEVRQRLHVQPYSCQVCSRSFTYKHNLAKHMLTHQAPEKFAEFHKSKLQEHLASGRPSYTCSVCSKVFMRKETLAKHSKVHTGTKPFKCEVCQREFTQNVHLKVHMRKHTGSRPFQCKRCTVGFIDSTALAKHIEYEACISENMLFHCTICDKRHYYLGSIKQHIKKEHNENDVDKFISRTVRQKRQRPANANIENACKICSKSFSEKVNLIRHVKRKHSDLLKLLQDDLSRTGPDKTLNQEESHTARSDEGYSTTPTQETHLHQSHDAAVSLKGNYAVSKENCAALSLSGPKNDTNDNGNNHTLVQANTHYQPMDQETDSFNQKDVLGLTSNTEQEITTGTSILTATVNGSREGPSTEGLVPQHSHSDILVPNNADNRLGVEENYQSPKSDERGKRDVSEGKDNVHVVREEERDERITEPNVNKFLYYVGLVEKSKAVGLEQHSIDSGYRKDESNNNSCLTSSCSSDSSKKSSDYCPDMCSGYSLANTDSSRIIEKIEEMQNQSSLAGGGFRTNLEVFCDLALMTEHRPIFHRKHSSNEHGISGSTCSNSFQPDVNGQRADDNSTSSVTEAQLKELGLLVCKDAQTVRNERRPSEDLYAEFKPWLEQLVKPTATPSSQSSMHYSTKTNTVMGLSSLPTGVETVASHSQPSSNIYIDNRQQLGSTETSTTGSHRQHHHHHHHHHHNRYHHHLYSANNSKPVENNQPLMKYTDTAAATATTTAITGIYKSTPAFVTSVSGGGNSIAPPPHGRHPNPEAPASTINHDIHSALLKEQFLQYIREIAENTTATATIITTTPAVLTTANSNNNNNNINIKRIEDSSAFSKTNNGKEAYAQTQTPLYFDSTTCTDTRTSYNNEDDNIPNRPPSLSLSSSSSSSTSSSTSSSPPPPPPPSSSAATSSTEPHLLQDSKILHSLLGGIQQQMKAILPHDDAFHGCNLTTNNIDINDNNNNNNSSFNLPTTTASTSGTIVSARPNSLRSNFFVSSLDHHDGDPSPPLQIDTKTRLPSTSSTCSSSSSSSSSSCTTHASKTKGPFPCQGCGKCFNARHQLKRHEMTHTEIRPYRCAECGKAFRQKVHLSDHLKRHRGQRPFLCTVCGKRFVLKNELKQHTKNYCRKAPSIVAS